ncbi:hypothetical protein ACFWJY_04775 [Streptomyces anulatus]|uniref:hypothetical protein n=1 Tax=Streptomyces anulatus TaxID=1892 RepID=UPI003667FE22
MANIVWHEKWGIELNLTRDDLGHESIPNLWELLYQSDRIDALRNVPVASRGLQCGGVCREAGVIAWMYLRVKSNERREAVHGRSEDEQRHHASLSDEHKAYQERIMRAADSVGYPADSESVRPWGRGRGCRPTRSYKVRTASGSGGRSSFPRPERKVLGA